MVTMALTFRRRSANGTVARGELPGWCVGQGGGARNGVLLLTGKRCRGDTTSGLNSPPGGHDRDNRGAPETHTRTTDPYVTPEGSGGYFLHTISLPAPDSNEWELTSLFCP